MPTNYITAEHISAEFFTSHSFHILFCFISGLCCFLPLILGVKSNLETAKLRDSLSSSEEFSYSCIASLSIVIPLFFDVFLDIINILDTPIDAVNKNLTLKTSGTVRFSFLNISERILILLGVIVLPLMVFIPRDTSNLALIYICCNKCQQNWIGGTVALSLSRYNVEYFSLSFTSFSLVSLGLGMVSSTFIDNVCAVKPVPESLYVLDLASFVLTFIPCALFFFNSSRWLIVVYYNLTQWKSILFCRSPRVDTNPDTNSSIPDRTQFHTFFPMVYTLCGMIVVLLLCILIGSTSRIEDYTERNLLQSNTPFLVLVILISILSMRMVKFEVVQGLYALIDSKKSYVRYISHELRTPLNSAFLGLKLLTDDLNSSSNPKDIERCDILADVNVACRITVDILNDLLCFDKMESGILEVHKLEVPVLAFIDDCVGMFSAQAKEGGITMSVVTGLDEGSESLGQHLALLDDDTVFIDRFKMDQVIRNLVSNALKFTPRGGSVTVTASFVPSEIPTTVVMANDPVSADAQHLEGSLVSDLIDFSSRTLSKGCKSHYQIHCDADLEGGEHKPLPAPETPTIVKGKLVVEVKDTGAGMMEEDYSRLFKEIVQFKPEVLQAGGGSGLGLWITKGIVDLHGGTVSVHSEGLGMGSSFMVELYMERVVTSRQISATNSVMIRQSVPFQQDTTTGTSTLVVYFDSQSELMHLLIVDDSPLNRKMLLKTFRAAGHICEEAEDGLVAVAKVKARMASDEKIFSAILMDFVMPNMDGPTATREIRALGYSAPIFGVTGNTLDSDVTYFLRNGADRVLAKPLDIDTFKLALEKLKKDPPY